MSDIAAKWGQAVADRGFAQVPNYLLLINQFLSEEARLKPAELLLLIQLVGSWWHKDQLPFPSIRTLAERCGVSERQVQRALLRLEKLGFLKRVSRRSHGGIIQSNSYDLSPAAALLSKVAEAFPNAFPRKGRKLTAISSDIDVRIAQAIAEHGSTAYTTPSGPILTLLTALADEDDLTGFSEAVVRFTRAKPGNAGFVINAVPGKISNFLMKHRQVEPSDFMQWSGWNSDWEDRVKDAVLDSNRFPATVEMIAQEIKTYAASRVPVTVPVLRG